jgi:hypothetical protein
VTREGTRPLAALAAAVLAAGFLAACGGSGSNSSSASTSTEAASQGGKTSTEKAAPQGSNAQKKDGGGSTGSSGKGSSESTPGNVSTPLKVSGGGSAQFRTKGGDNSIQGYGAESGETELQQAAEAVHGFYVARAKEEWAKACSYLAKSNIEQLEQLVSQSPRFKGKGCAPVLHAFTRPLPASVQREITTVDAGSLRVGKEHSVLIYRGAGRTVYAMPLTQEGGEWKLTALSGDALG